MDETFKIAFGVVEHKETPLVCSNCGYIFPLNWTCKNCCENPTIKLGDLPGGRGWA
jgi:hypothetical protein